MSSLRRLACRFVLIEAPSPLPRASPCSRFLRTEHTPELFYCLKNGINKVEIYHDYEGIGAWADRHWKANNPLTQGYRDFVAEARQTMEISFVKVKAHSGNKYNEIADKLAKEALSE